MKQRFLYLLVREMGTPPNIINAFPFASEAERDQKIAEYLEDDPELNIAKVDTTPDNMWITPVNHTMLKRKNT